MTFTIHSADLAPNAAESNATSTTLSFSPSAVVAVDKLAVCLICWDNADGTNADDTTKLSVADSKSNTWLKGYEAQYSPGGVAEDGLCNGIYYSVITTQLETTDTITITSGSSKNKAVAMAAFNRDTSKVVAVAGGAAERVNATAYTVTIGSLTSEEHLWVGHNAMERTSTDTNTKDTTFTAITQGAGNSWGIGSGLTDAIGGRGGYLIETSTTQTYDHAGPLGVADRCTVLVAFREETPPGGATTIDPMGMRGFFGA